MKRLPLILLAITMVGCGQKADKPNTPAPLGKDTVARLPSLATPNQDSDVLVSVAGNAFTRAEAREQVEKRISSQGRGVPAEQRQAFVEMTWRAVLEQFIVRNLFLAEADRAGITVEPEDEEQALARIDAHLRLQGSSLEAVKEQRPAADWQRMLDEVRIGIRVEKFLADNLEQEMPTISDEDLDAFMAQNADRLLVPETAEARHIFVAKPEDGDPVATQAKLEKAKDLRAQLLAGADFAELAKAQSEYPSKQQGGDLGTLTRGQVIAPLEEAIFGQEIDAIGPLVEVEKGYHIIQVTNRLAPHTMSREQVSEILEGERRRAAMIALVTRLAAGTEVAVAESIVPLLPDYMRTGPRPSDATPEAAITPPE